MKLIEAVSYIEDLRNNEPRGLYITALTYAVDSMEKQIPKKPYQSGVTTCDGVFHPVNGINGVPYDLCPSCDTNLCTNGCLGEPKMKHCKNCGQKLDWGD